MARRPQKSVTVELFPFLAVLVCVMGALIFLLLVMTKRLRAVAVAKAQAAVVQTLDDRPILPVLADDVAVEDPLPATLAPDLAATPLVEPPGWSPAPAMVVPEEEVVDRQAHFAALDALQQQWTTKVASLESDRDRQQGDLNRQRLLVMTTEKEIADLQHQLLQRESELAAVMGRLSATQGTQSATAAERIQLEQVIRQLRQQLKQLEAQQQASSSQYVVVPFEGKSGTTRRPILVECTSTGLKFLPEEVTLVPQDLEGFTPRLNPLLSGSQALVNYWSQQAPAPGQSAEEPYVLLIVRPNGTLAYYIAMRLLSGMKQPFGYELVTADMSLQTGPVDPAAKAALEEAIQLTLAERERLAAALSLGTGAGRGTGGTERSGTAGGSGPPAGPVTPRGSPAPSSSPRRNTAPQGKAPGEFALSDLEEPGTVGQRSWEDIDRFKGQEFRRKGPASAASSGASNPGDATTNEDARAGGNGNPPRELRTTPDQPPGAATATGNPAAASAAGARNQQPASEATDWRARSGSAAGQPGTDAVEADYPNFNQAASRAQAQAGKTLPYEQLHRRKWGPHDDGASIGVEKPVRVRVDSETLVVDTVSVPITAGMSREQVFHQLLMALDQQAQGWGKPGTGFFWVPSLRFEVLPGGNTTFERVSPLVLKSGLSHSTDYSLGQSAPALPETVR